MPTTRLDKLDRQILDILQTNGRIAIVDLAAQVNLSPTPCAVRVKRMEAEGIITGYSANINREKIGLDIMAIILVKIKENTKEVGEEFISSIAKSHSIDKCFMTIGRIDYILHVYAINLNDLEDILRQDVASLPHVLSLETILVLRANSTQL